MSQVYNTKLPKEMQQHFTEEKLSEFKEAFHLFDKNGDGVISVRELQTVLRSLGQDPSPSDLHGFIRSADRNRNGTIEFMEFLDIMVKVLGDTETDEELAEIFRVLDQDGDDVISKSDIREVVTRLGLDITHQDLEEMIEVTDKDGDGHIQFEEFRKLMTSRT